MSPLITLILIIILNTMIIVLSLYRGTSTILVASTEVLLLYNIHIVLVHRDRGGGAYINTLYIGTYMSEL